jgi:phosphonoacetaldehyde hydrolase
MMELMTRHSYRGPLKAAILDWAGTTVDYGSFAPTAVFLKVFERQGVPITIEQARTPMGLMKRDHLRAIAQMRPVAHRWQEVHARPCTDDDIEAMFQEFVPLQIACLTEYADLIPGTLETMAEFRKQGLKIGSTTGYTREMMQILVPEVEKRGYKPDACVCPTDAPAGRPYPWMCYQNAIQLQIYPMAAMVKIGDTLPDIEEGLNAGMWTIGLALSGNELGLTAPEVAALPAQILNAKREQISSRMYQAGAHYVVDGIWACVPIIQDINVRLARGEHP